MAINFELGHNECRKRVCVCCYRKADRPLSERDNACIQLHLIQGYNVANPDFPNIICSGGHLELSFERVKRGDYIHIFHQYQKLILLEKSSELYSFFCRIRYTFKNIRGIICYFLVLII